MPNEIIEEVLFHKRITFHVSVKLVNTRERNFIVHDDGWQIRINDENDWLFATAFADTDSARTPDVESAQWLVAATLRESQRQARL